jgi:hypothetical protein
MRIPTLLALVLFLGFQIQAQNTGSLTGTVKDKLTQEALIGVSIKLEGSEIGAATDLEGNFRITGIPSKSYNVVASYVRMERRLAKCWFPSIGRCGSLRQKPRFPSKAFP